MPGVAARPVDAAGLVLIRNGRRGLEVLLGRRNRRHSFLPDVFVFPGGRVDPGDAIPSGFGEVLQPALIAALRRGAGRRDPASFLRAALRETFEETGLLLARDAPGRPPAASSRSVWQAFRDAGARPAFDDVEFLCRAITPRSSPRRYNTRFFLADGAAAVGDLRGNGELEELDWWPIEATARLPIVDVTEFVLGEALRRRGQPLPPGAQRPLLCYRNDIMGLRQA